LKKSDEHNAQTFQNKKVKENLKI